MLFRERGRRHVLKVQGRRQNIMIISPQIFARELQKHRCVFEDAQGEIHGIGCFRIEEMDGEPLFVFVSDEVKIIEAGEITNTD